MCMCTNGKLLTVNEWVYFTRLAQLVISDIFIFYCFQIKFLKSKEGSAMVQLGDGIDGNDS